MEITVSVKLLPPSMPNFISVDFGSTTAKAIPVAELTEAQALEYAELMRQQFILHWQEKSKKKNG